MVPSENSGSAFGRGPVDLERKFIPYRSSDDGMTDVLRWGWQHEAVSWESILKHRLVVILGEAGSGKTTEFRQRAMQRSAEGCYAFYLTVEDLGRNGVTEGLPPADLDRLEEWQGSEDVAHFFVDSVDEARLSRLKLRGAIRKLARFCYKQMCRARVLLSCRISDWRPREDLEALAEELRPPTKGRGSEADSGEGEAVNVYSLAPLVLDQVEALAAHLGVGDARAFRMAAEHAGVEAFLGRPGDVASMARYWNERRGFGSLTEMVEADINEKLQERNPDRQPILTLERVRAAAHAVAGLAWLSGASAFELNDGTLDLQPNEHTLDVASVLPDLTKDEVRDILTRPLFDEATYGRVRIHHRSCQEYLVARWLGELLARGLPRVDIEQLLFWQGPEELVVPARWVAIAAWMAGTDSTISERLRHADPVAFLRAGDPSLLTASSRGQIIDAIVERYGGRQRLPGVTDNNTVRRFAHGCPEDRVRLHLESVESEGIQTILLEVALEGRMSTCVDAALRIACHGAAGRPRWEAIEMVVAVGAVAQIEAMLQTLIDDAVAIDHEVGGALVFHGFPRCMDVDRLLLLLGRVDAPPPNTGTLLPHDLGNRVARSMARAVQARFLGGLLQLVQDPGNSRAIRPGRQWLVEPLASTLDAWCAGATDDELPAMKLHFMFLSGLSFYGHIRHELGELRIGQMLAREERVRRALFWWDVELSRAKASAARPAGRARPVTKVSDIDRECRLWKLTGKDVGWLIADARSRPIVTDRLMAFDALQELSSQGVETERHLFELASEDPALGRRHRRSRPMFVPRSRSREERTAEVWAARDARCAQDERKSLLQRIDGIRAGNDHDALRWLVEEGIAGRDVSSREKAAQRFGHEIVHAAQDGLMRMWRSLPASGLQEWSADDVDRARIARCGLELELERGLSLETIDEATALVAASLAALRLNGRPPWIDRLAEAHPAAVATVFEACIEREYNVEKGGEGSFRSYRVLYHLSHEPMIVRRLCRPMVLDRLRAKEPVLIETLEHSLQALVAVDESHDELADLARGRFAAAADDPPRRILWWIAWLAADTDGATTAIEAELAVGGSAADEAMLAYCSQLWRFVETVRYFPQLTGTHVLGRLVALACAHIRAGEDVPRLGAYIPGPRHRAESVRGWWQRALVEAPDSSVYLELRRVAELPQCAAWRDWFLASADNRLREMASGAGAAFVARVLAAYRKYGLAALDYVGSIGAALEGLRDQSGPISDDVAVKVLSLLPADSLDYVVRLSGIDSALVAPRTAKPMERALDIVRQMQNDPTLRSSVTAALRSLIPAI